jgi:CRP-like cAMP-binding protein
MPSPDGLHRGNRILAALPDTVFAPIRSALVRVLLPAGETLCERGTRLEYLDFPHDGVVSFLYVADGRRIETTTVGREGVVGVGALLGDERVDHAVMVRIPGAATRIPLRLFAEVVEKDPAAHALIMRYAKAQLAHATQLAACNAGHSLEQRLCRWLLLAHDRSRSEVLNVTQDGLAEALGVRRQGISEGMRGLCATQAVSAGRGWIAVLDRARLEARSCECYSLISNAHAGVLAPYPPGGGRPVRAAS